MNCHIFNFYRVIYKFQNLVRKLKFLMIFCTGMCHFMVSTRTLSRNFEEKVGPFQEFLCLMEVSKIRFWGLFWDKWLPFFTKFPKIVNFSPNLVKIIMQFGHLLVCHLCHQNNLPYLGISSRHYNPFRNFSEKLTYPFGIFSWKYDPKKWRTPLNSTCVSSPPWGLKSCFYFKF